MNVEIIEIKTGRLLATYPIILGGLTHTPSEQEFFAEAWRCALEDNLVTSFSRDQYAMNLLPEE